MLLRKHTFAMKVKLLVSKTTQTNVLLVLRKNYAVVRELLQIAMMVSILLQMSYLAIEDLLGYPTEELWIGKFMYHSAQLL